MQELDPSEPLFDLAHVNVMRADRLVLNDVSLRLEQDEHLVILGPNGCGKSTLLKTLTCELYPLVRPETRVRILGRQRWDLQELRRMLGVVSAELPGKPTLTTTGLDAIVTGFFSSSTLWPNLAVTDAMRARAEELLVLVGAESLRDRHVGEMSAGQQRRIMIGRALAGTTGGVQMLLLDEPSNALDLAAQHDLRELMRTLAARGIALVLITHHIADILPEMRRVLMMREGRIIADGPKNELLTAPKLTELFGREVQLRERNGFFDAW